jgi:hypothetical protein
MFCCFGSKLIMKLALLLLLVALMLQLQADSKVTVFFLFRGSMLRLQADKRSSFRGSMLRLQADKRAVFWNGLTVMTLRLQADVKNWELGLPAQSSVLFSFGLASFCKFLRSIETS